MGGSRRVVLFLTVTSLALSAAALVAQQAAAPPAAALDFEFFKTRVQPIFVAKREAHARCVACHTTASNMRLQPLPAGTTMWNDADSRKNFDAVRRMVIPGSLKSRLLLHPLAKDAGGDHFHAGGKHWKSQNDPEWQTLAAWVNGQTVGGSK